MAAMEEEKKNNNALRDKTLLLVRNYFLDNVMWEVKAELPALILLVILCAATFILTDLALKNSSATSLLILIP